MPQRVRVPLRVIVGSYSDATVSVYVKIAALDRRTTGCEAGVAYLAGLLGLARSTVERALTQLMRPAPDDDVVELTSQRRTYEGGMGQTAVRRIRATNPRREHGAWVPTRASESLSPRQLRCYAALAYATATGAHITLGELARVLRHHSGQKAGQPLDARTVRRILRELAQLGWITVDRRAGYRGRHVYTVHDEPMQAALTADTGEGSGGDLREGSLASKEHHPTDSPDDVPPTAVSSSRRRRVQEVARGPVDDAPLPAALRRPYSGPELTLAPRIWRVLEPVNSLLPGLSPYVVRQLAREIGRQLDEGQEPARLRARLEFRLASTEDVRDVGRWLLGAAVVRHGCGLVACESGRIWHAGARCDVCTDLRAADGQRPPGRPPSPPAPPGSPPGPRRPGRWHECRHCQAPSRQPLPDGLCRTCRTPEPATPLRRWP
ncbi:hypothetical protein STRCI_001336 [Streptomyces cinnabarinus]|uniref:Helix-turn-helix domain-containing protein n=1 Tax=Streptomyces cinnabarinus TaxID=67287 RepID=A0ABY7K6W0_9ACTN|nr:hypothetical protein [Streptomyces cinnabarinus]WAZ20235.1 hypothetical protein STRCI_001336 [Streptomyces cinnabarinus]